MENLEKDCKQGVSNTLITKILMGTLGCVPAYDRYFIKGIREYKVASGNFNINSILQLTEFYEKYFKEFENARTKMNVGELEYPQMKLLDMCFWQIGFDLDDSKGFPIAH